MDLAWPPPLCEKNPHFSVAKATLELLMSSEGVVILNLRCGYIENGVVISVSHKNPSASQNHAYQPNLSQSIVMPISHRTTHPPFPPSLPPSAFQNYNYQPSCPLYPSTILPIQLSCTPPIQPVSNCQSSCQSDSILLSHHGLPCPLPQPLKIIIISPHAYQPSCPSTIMPIQLSCPPPSSHYANQQLFLSTTMTYKPSCPPRNSA